MNLKILIISTALLIGSLNTSFAQVQPNTNSAYLINEQTDYKISTGGSNVNLRSGPGTNYSIIAKIPNNSVITKISDYSNGKWAKTVFVGNKGREYIGYILYDENYVKEYTSIPNSFGEITANRVIFRKEGHKWSSKLGYFYKGNTVEILENANKDNYIKIRVINTNGDYKDNVGYVHKDYVKKTT